MSTARRSARSTWRSASSPWGAARATCRSRTINISRQSTHASCCATARCSCATSARATAPGCSSTRRTRSPTPTCCSSGRRFSSFRRLGYPSRAARGCRRHAAHGLAHAGAGHCACWRSCAPTAACATASHLAPGRTITIGRDGGDWTFPYDQTMSGRHAEMHETDGRVLHPRRWAAATASRVAVRGERPLKIGPARPAGRPGAARGERVSVKTLPAVRHRVRPTKRVLSHRRLHASRLGARR